MISLLNQLSFEKEVRLSQHIIYLTSEDIVIIRSVQREIDVSGVQEVIEWFENHGNDNLHILFDPTYEISISREARKMIVANFNKWQPEVAILINSSISRFIFNMIQNVDKPKFNIKPYKYPHKAYEWLFRKLIDELKEAS